MLTQLVSGHASYGKQNVEAPPRSSPSYCTPLRQKPGLKRKLRPSMFKRLIQGRPAWSGRDVIPGGPSDHLFLGFWQSAQRPSWCGLLSSTFQGPSLFIHNLKSSQPEKERLLTPFYEGENRGLENLRNSPRVPRGRGAEPYSNPNLPCSEIVAPGRRTPHCLSLHHSFIHSTNIDLAKH